VLWAGELTDQSMRSRTGIAHTLSVHATIDGQ